MKLHIVSDLHLEFGDWTPAATDADVVVLAGDIGTAKFSAVEWAGRTFEKPVVLVLGNHDYYGGQLLRTLQKLRLEAQSFPHVHLLERDSLVLDGVRILGTTLWTDYSLTGNQPLAEWDAQTTLKDFKFVRNADFAKLKPFHVLKQHAASRNFLARELETPFDGPTVVVTHHAPSGRCIPERHLADTNSHLNAAYASNLEAFLGGDVKLWVHGHIHDSVDLQLGDTRVVCNPRGYDTPTREHLNPNFIPDLVVEV